MKRLVFSMVGLSLASVLVLMGCSGLGGDQVLSEAYHRPIRFLSPEWLHREALGMPDLRFRV